jgi:hypothetical protein
MAKFSNNLKTRSRRSFVQSTVGALAAIPLASTCFKNNAKSQEERQTSPIIVGGGGSVGIDFKASEYHGDPTVGQFTRPNDTLHKLWLIDKYGGLYNITPAGNEKCTITILCRRRRRHETTIVIEGDPLKVKFDPGEFRYDYPPEGSKKIYHNTKHKIVDISVYDKVSHQTQHHTPPTKGKCTLVVVDTY